MIARLRPVLPAAGAAVRPLRIGTIGLDTLHTLRLKVAASLLLADRIQAELVQIGTEVDGIGLLVGDAEDPVAQQALLQAAQSGLPVLSISRSGRGPGASPLTQGASVRQIHQQLLDLLAGHCLMPVEGRCSVFDWLAQHRGQPCLLHNGLLRLAIGPDRDQVHLLRSLPVEAFAAKLGQKGWSAEVLDAVAWQQVCADAVASHPWEALCWLAALQGPLPSLPQTSALRLRYWPDVDVSQLPTTWLVALTALLQQPWQASELAAAMGLDTTEMEALFAVVAWSGLADASPATSALPHAPAFLVRPFTGLLGRLARRFGLAIDASTSGAAAA